MSINKDGLDTSKQPTFSQIMKVEIARKRGETDEKPKAKKQRKQKVKSVDSNLPTEAKKEEVE